MSVNEVLIVLRSLATPDHLSKFAHFGINDPTALGVKVPLLRNLAKEIGRNHELALELWKTGIKNPFNQFHKVHIRLLFIEFSK